MGGMGEAAVVGTVDLVMIGIVILVTLVGRYLLVRLVRRATKRAVERAKERRTGSETRAERILSAVTMARDERAEQRTATLGSLITNLISVALIVVGVLTILAILDIPLGPLLASAGVGGVAIAFGAQSLVKDYLSGLFMILEDQYGVGDLVDTGEVVGTVEEVTMRITRVRDSTGKVWYIRNGEILRLGNLSQGWSTATVDVPVANDEDAAKCIAVLEQVADEVDQNPEFADVLLERPSVAGVDSVNNTTMTLRMFAKTAPNKHWGMQRVLLARAHAALVDAGIRVPRGIGGYGADRMS